MVDIVIILSIPISSITGNHIRSQYVPYKLFDFFLYGKTNRFQYILVPVYYFFPYGNAYMYLISPNTGNCSDCNISSRTYFYFFQYVYITMSYVSINVKTYMRVLVLVREENKTTGLEDIRSEYIFPYWTK